MRTAGYIDRLPYSRDGFVVNGFKDEDGVLHMSNIRIFKQRSIQLFDLMDISTGKIYQKVQITSTIGNSQTVLDYTNTDVDLAQQIKENSFFIRNFDKQKQYYGFIVRVLSNKVTIDSRINVSHYIYNYDLYIKDEPKIFSLTYNKPSAGDTSFSFIVNGQFLDPATLSAKLTLEDGTVYIGTSIGFQVTFDNINLVGTNFTVLVEADNAIDYTEIIPIDNVPGDDKIVSEFIIPSSDWIQGSSGEFSNTVDQTEHERGNFFCIQTFENTDMVFISSTIDYNGAITFTKNDNQEVKVRLAGQSDDIDMIVIDVTEAGWVQTGDGYYYSIPSSQIGREFSIFNIWIDNGTRYELVYNPLAIDFSSNIVLQSNAPYKAKLIIV